MAPAVQTNVIVNVTKLQEPAFLHQNVLEDSMDQTVRQSVIVWMVQHVTGWQGNVKRILQLNWVSVSLDMCQVQVST